MPSSSRTHQSTGSSHTTSTNSTSKAHPFRESDSHQGFLDRREERANVSHQRENSCLSPGPGHHRHIGRPLTVNQLHGHVPTSTPLPFPLLFATPHPPFSFSLKLRLVFMPRQQDIKCRIFFFGKQSLSDPTLASPQSPASQKGQCLRGAPIVRHSPCHNVVCRQRQHASNTPVMSRL
jgi:hypothetical protein